MRRREVLALLASLSGYAPVTLGAQSVRTRALIAILFGGSQASSVRHRDGFSHGFADLNLVEGRDIDVIYRYADADPSRLSPILADIVQLQPSVIVADTTFEAVTAQRATAGTPIVCAALTDPIRVGLVESYAHPGGTVTGILNNIETFPAKQMVLAVEIAPDIRRLGALLHRNNFRSEVYRQSAVAAATSLGLELMIADVHSTNDFEAAVQSFVQQRVRMVLVQEDPMFLSQRRRIAELAITAGLPTMYGLREHAEEGGLISYGADVYESFQRTAALVAQIVSGSLPADLPIEFAPRVELILNLKTAKALGLTFPSTLLSRADAVIV